LPGLPGSLDQLDLLLLTVAKPRKIHPDGILCRSNIELRTLSWGYAA
jgi:hypothetical protein